jgi:hypothetical protein
VGLHPRARACCLPRFPSAVPGKIPRR